MAAAVKPTPLEPLRGADSYTGPQDPVRFVTAPDLAADGDVPTLVWLAGSAHG